MAKLAESDRNRTVIKDVAMQPEYATVRTTSALFGLSRTMLFSLLAKGRIRSVHHKEPGNVRGVQLIELQSVRDYLQNLAAAE